MRVILNIIWLILAGVWLALGYLIAAALMAITIIGLEFPRFRGQVLIRRHVLFR